MKIYTTSGLELDITRLGNGDTNVEVICPHKSLNRIEESLQDINDTVFEIVELLKKEGIISSGQPGKKVKRINPTDSLPSLKLYPVKGKEGQIKWVSTPPQKKKVSPHANDLTGQKRKKAKVIYESPAPKPAYIWEPTKNNNKQAPPPVTTYGVTPVPDAESSSSDQPAQNIPYQFVPSPINQQASTYVAPPVHMEIIPQQQISPPVIIKPKSGDNDYDEIAHNNSQTFTPYLFASGVGIQGYFKVNSYAAVSNYSTYIVPTANDPYTSRQSYTPTVFVSATGITGAQAQGDITWTGKATVYRDGVVYSWATLNQPPADQAYIISDQTSLIGQATLNLPATGNITVELQISYIYKDETGSAAPLPRTISIPLTATKFQ